MASKKELTIQKLDHLNKRVPTIKKTFEYKTKVGHLKSGLIWYSDPTVPEFRNVNQVILGKGIEINFA